MLETSMAFTTLAKHSGSGTMFHTGEMNNFGTVVCLSQKECLPDPVVIQTDLWEMDSSQHRGGADTKNGLHFC
jgi:hypothetical protein